jgi:hypothetical protein
MNFLSQQSGSKPDGEDDKLFSLGQRFTYFQDKSPANKSLDIVNPQPFHLRRTIRPPARYKNSRMTVRLRPRQVLCSKCRSICNENSENVDLSRKRKGSEQMAKVDKKLCTPCEVPSKSPRPLFSENQSDNQPIKSASPPSENSKLCSTLIPKISRLQPTEISNALGGNVNKIKIVEKYWTRPNVGSQGDCVREHDEGSNKVYCVSMDPKMLVEDRNCDSDHSSVHNVSGKTEDEVTWPADSASSVQELAASKERMVLRKKRSVGSMEDLWDESVFEDSMRKARNARTTPVIKISFGSQGEGTVLKIPAKVQKYIPSESETEEKADQQKQKTKDASAKAAKRALKKAKKEARRKMLSASGASPRSLGGGSPAYAIGGTSPAYEALYHRKHKHKVKHKKRHKEERRHSKNEATGPMLVKGVGEPKCWNILAPSDSYSAIKERCLKQKLSISLKRLNANAYMRCDYLGSNGSKSPGTSSCSNSELSDDHGETVPDFPPPTSHPLMMRISTQTVGWCVTGDGRRMAVGDVVWGKIHGFPWWPGKVKTLYIYFTYLSGNTADTACELWGLEADFVCVTFSKRILIIRFFVRSEPCRAVRPSV